MPTADCKTNTSSPDCSISLVPSGPLHQRRYKMSFRTGQDHLIHNHFQLTETLSYCLLSIAEIFLLITDVNSFIRRCNLMEWNRSQPFTSSVQTDRSPSQALYKLIAALHKLCTNRSQPFTSSVQTDRSPSQVLYKLIAALHKLCTN